MSDNTRSEAAPADPPHPARCPHSPQHLPASRGGWPDARSAEVLLSGDGCATPPTVPADRLVRLLAAAREVRAPLDPAREAAALAAFRTAAAGRRAGRARARRGPLAALRTAFAVRRPRMMAAAVVSALAIGGVAVGMAAAARSFTPGAGGGTGPMGTRPPAAVSPDGATAGPWTAGPGAPAAPSVPGGASGDRHAAGTHGYGYGYGCGQPCRHAQPGHCPHGRSAAKGPQAGQSALPGGRGKHRKGGGGGKGAGGTPEKQDKHRKPAKADKAHAGGPRHTRPGRHSPSRASGR